MRRRADHLDPRGDDLQIHSTFATLRAQPHLSVLTEHGDAELERIARTLDHHVLVESRGDLEELLGQLMAQAEESGSPVVPKTLDLIGHARPVTSLLQLGDWVLDGDSPVVTAFFRELAEQDVLRRCGIHAVRLLGCHTAATTIGRRTLATLSNILGVEVYGTTSMVFASHYTPTGFGADWRFLLAASSDLRRPVRADDVPAGEPDPRPLDIDGLPAVALMADPARLPRFLVERGMAQRLLRLVRRTEGAQMPGLLTAPHSELALPAGAPGMFHLLQVMLEGTFVRTYPRGADQPGVLYPVRDPAALRDLLLTLPPC